MSLADFPPNAVTEQLMRRNLAGCVPLLLLALAGCAAGGGERQQRISDALEQLTTDTEYADTKRCLSSLAYDQIEVLDDRHLLFRDRNEYWLNELRSRCPGLTRNDTLLFERRSSQLCALDSAEVVERFLFWRRTGPVCTLGEFHELTEAQAELLRRAMER
jgi:hypothetical protein